MKLETFGVLAFCLVFAHASIVRVEPVEQSIKSLDDYAESLNEKAEQISKEVDQKYEEVIVQPIERIEATAQAIEERKEENEQCVDQQASEVDAVLLNFENSLDTCAQEAAISGYTVAEGIAKTSVEITYDTYKLVKGVQRCRRYSNSILKNTCYAKQLVKAKILLSKTLRAVDALNNSVDETLPKIVVDLEECSASAEEYAQAQLELINSSIDNCVAKL